MTTDLAPGAGGAPPDEVLQFEHAELPPALSARLCNGCRQPMQDVYYEIQGKVLCADCRARVEARFGGGSEPARFARAALFGAGAALAGAAIFLLVFSVLGYPVWLTFLVVGYMTGMAVRKGAGHRGGWHYQVLAVVLTYAGMASGILALVILSLIKGGLRIGPNLPAAVASAFEAPLVIATNSIMGLVIVVFALVQAWRLNPRFRLPISGPFRVQSDPSPLEEAPAHV